ncbi:DMSO reductase anchor subunit [Scopulibacillus daqui]|uniref:DMSO reductase anchor subunit n=1 Tax=Scopulibacillus daqui TaxID=1469162 RepID=A0ABS2PWP4_9BACL|nr:DMSO reductase anchor subunit [Scopulibacillus daqui]
MSYKKMFNIGYAVYLGLLILIYIFSPIKHGYQAIVILTLIFGIYNLVLMSKYEFKKHK